MLILGIVLVMVLMGGCRTVTSEDDFDYLLTYSRIDDSADARDTLTVSQDGSVQVSKRSGSPTTVQLSSSELAELQALVAKVDLADLDFINAPERRRDGYAYQLKTSKRSVAWHDSASPEPLWPLQDKLDSLIASAQ